MLTTVLIISIIIILAVILITVLTTSKAYQYQHTVDPLPNEADTPEAHEKEKTNT